MAASFEIGDLVWAKMKGFPFWPARVWDPANAPKPPKTNKAQCYVNFFGSHNFAWILEEFIIPHSDKMLDVSKAYKKMHSTMQEGILEIEAITKIKTEPSMEGSLQLPSTSRKAKVPTRLSNRKIEIHSPAKVKPFEENTLQEETTHRKTKVAKRLSKKKLGEKNESIFPLIMKTTQKKIEKVPRKKVEPSEAKSLKLETISKKTKVSQKPPRKKIKMDSKVIVKPSGGNFFQLEATFGNPKVPNRSSKRKKDTDSQIKIEPLEENSLQLEATSGNPNLAKRKNGNTCKVKVEPSEEKSLPLETTSIITKVSRKPPSKKKINSETNVKSTGEKSLQQEIASGNPKMLNRCSKRKNDTNCSIKTDPSEENSLKLEATSRKTKGCKRSYKKKIGLKKRSRVSFIKKNTQKNFEKFPRIKVEPLKKSLQRKTSSGKIKLPKKSSRKNIVCVKKKSKIPLINKIPQRKTERLVVQSASVSNSSVSANFVQPDFDLPSTSAVQQSPKIRKSMPFTSIKKIGFIGLGMMGAEIVRSFLNTGYYVTIWNRTKQKCNEFLEKGVRVAETPADVIRMCEVTFCCVANSDASRAIFWGENGVLDGLTYPRTRKSSFKGYVELSSIDPETSIEIGNAFCEAGGVYLEAPLIGSRQNVDNRGLTIISAGDSMLFDLCTTCFAAFTSKVSKISDKVGDAAKMNLALCMVTGSAYASLNEAMGMLRDLNLNPNIFLCCIALGQQCCSFFLDKGHAMVSKDPTVHIPLKKVKRDMEMAISLAQECHQPLEFAETANEILKRAAEQFPEHDATALQMCSNL